ncbi:MULTISPECIES: hypothetical protein [Ensifer]|uniref:hypothetical protein n=1 Tax=Ensifer TaxID=106591 RepID=UPI000DD4FD35|nr:MULTISPECIES: hypothetical protein [Ensifer]MBD9625518.1 hypothetical protein [Ensifer sp. ENS06]
MIPMSVSTLGLCAKAFKAVSAKVLKRFCVRNCERQSKQFQQKCLSGFAFGTAKDRQQFQHLELSETIATVPGGTGAAWMRQKTRFERDLANGLSRSKRKRIDP